MNLLFDRKQSSSALFSLVPLKFGSGVIFTLHAELEPTSEETTLMNRYKFNKAELADGNFVDEIRRALRPATLVSVIAFAIFWTFFGFYTSLSLAGIVLIVMTVVYFKTMREYILVSDLLNGGRGFRCDSIEALIKKEAWIESKCEYLRQVVESARTWDDRETIEIRPLDKEHARLAVLRSYG